MDTPCIFLGIKVKPGPIERFKLENFTLDNTVDNLRTEAEKKASVPGSSFELIHHGKIMKENATLQENGVKYGEMVHVFKIKEPEHVLPMATYTDPELQQLNGALRSLGCTPNATGWTRAMQLLTEEPVMNAILDLAPSLADDCVPLSILHEVELLAALGANLQTMRRGADAHPDLPGALMLLTRFERNRARTATPSDNGPAISGFSYSLEALSEEEDAEEEETEETERNPITQEQLAAALQAATEAVSSTSTRSLSARQHQNLLQLLRGSTGESSRNTQASPSSSAAADRAVITPEMFSEAITEAINRSGSTGTSGAPMEQSTEASAVRAVLTPEAFNEAISEAMSRTGTATGTPMEQSAAASSSQSPAPRDEEFTTQLNHMHEMGLLDDAVNIRALLICSGDVNAAINLVFSGAVGDD